MNQITMITMCFEEYVQSNIKEFTDKVDDIGKTVRDYKLVTVANFSSATLDTARNIAEKVGYFVQL